MVVVGALDIGDCDCAAVPDEPSISTPDAHGNSRYTGHLALDMNCGLYGLRL